MSKVNRHAENWKLSTFKIIWKIKQQNLMSSLNYEHQALGNLKNLIFFLFLFPYFPDYWRWRSSLKGWGRAGEWGEGQGMYRWDKGRFSLTIHVCFHSSKLNVYDDSAPLYHWRYYNKSFFFFVRIKWIYMNYRAYLMCFGTSPFLYWSWIIENRSLILAKQSL